jgi:hypothetical protein
VNGYPQSKEVDDLLSGADIDTLHYDSQFKQYRVRIDGAVEGKQRELLRGLISRASEGFGKGG